MILFKSGDRVRCIQEPSMTIEDRPRLAEEYTVTSFVDDDVGWIYLAGLTGSWRADRFIRVERDYLPLTRALELKEQAEVQAAHFLAQRDAVVAQLEDLKKKLRALVGDF